MPELPEIETIRTALSPQITGHRVSQVTLRRPNLRFKIPTELPKSVAQKRVVGVRRRSKYLLIDFENNQTLIIHLGMSGRFFFTDKKRTLDPHDHVLIDFDDGKHLRLRDPRRFGLLDICKTDKLTSNKHLVRLGVEPLENDFSASYLYAVCKKSSSPIKLIVMNAKNVVGVGNIYASEALFLAGIKPTRKGSSISREEAARLCNAIKNVLVASIHSGGTSFRDYVNLSEEPGLHQLSLKVYNRSGSTCFKCHSEIQKTIQSNRSTFYCPQCQK